MACQSVVNFETQSRICKTILNYFDCFYMNDSKLNQITAKGPVVQGVTFYASV